MAGKKIGEIVNKVYQKANESCVSGAKNALAVHVEDEIFNKHNKKISYRTIERAFDRHVFNDKSINERNSESISLLCKYLGFEDYKDYVKKNSSTTVRGIVSELNKWRLISTICISFVVILATLLIFNNRLFTDTNKTLIWYYKNNNGEMEYFTVPDLFPVNSRNLQKITPNIIQSYELNDLELEGLNLH